MIFKLASIYVPAEADYRKRYINKLHRTATLDKETIIGGDFNCVIKVDHDVQYSNQRELRRPYANLHGPLLTKMMNKAKLSDTHNRVNGENTGGYTREGKDIRTRIDRIYARENNSTLAWESSEINYDIVARIHTDHFPVIATAAALGRSKNKTHQARINTEVLLDPGTREEIIEDMEDAISKYGGWKEHKAKKVWEQFKINAYATLKRRTKQKKNEIRNSSHHYHLTGLQIRLRHILAKPEDPSMARYKKIEKLKEEIKEEWKKIRPASGQNAFSRFQQEEVNVETILQKIQK